MTTASVYKDYNCLIKNIEVWIRQQKLKIIWCEENAVSARIVQKIVLISYQNYTKYCDIKKKSYFGKKKLLDLAGIKFSLNNGKVLIGKKIWLKELINFVFLWFSLLCTIILSLFYKKPKKIIPCTLIFDNIPSLQITDSSFVQFIRKGPVKFLHSAKKIIVANKNPKKITNSKLILYHPHPIFQIILTETPKNILLKSFFWHLVIPFYYLALSIRQPLIFLLGSDFAFLPLVKQLNDRGLIKEVVVTTSRFSSQPLWMIGIKNQTFRLHMIWYSQNFIPKMYHGDVETPSLPPARHMRVHEHWVWTKEFRKYLRKINQKGKIHTVGPILWYLNKEKKTTLKINRIYKVAIFDVTPLNDKYLAFGAAKNYYSIKNMKKFIADIVFVCGSIAKKQNIKIKLILKNKRTPKKKVHSLDYLTWLNKNFISKKLLYKKHYNTNLFKFLNACHISICVPYTSAAYVGAFLKKKSVFYDSTSSLIPKIEKNKNIKFAKTKHQLKKIILKDILKYKN